MNAINPAADKLLGGDPSAAVRVAFFIAVIAAWGLIAATDILARAYATAHAALPPAPAALPPAPAAAGYLLAPLASPLAAVNLEGRDREGFAAVAVRSKGKDEIEFMLVKQGQAPIWVAADKVELWLSNSS